MFSVSSQVNHEMNGSQSPLSAPASANTEVLGGLNLSCTLDHTSSPIFIGHINSIQASNNSAFKPFVATKSPIQASRSVDFKESIEPFIGSKKTAVQILVGFSDILNNQDKKVILRYTSVNASCPASTANDTLQTNKEKEIES